MLLLEGKVSQQWLHELRSEIDKSLSEGKRLILDFSKVTYIDEEGAKLVSRPHYKNIEKRNCSLFIRTMLDVNTRGKK
ncbi:MAG: hypothetical protein PVF22_02150 [Candidatus Aminicenantes bacterium]